MLLRICISIALYLYLLCVCICICIFDLGDGSRGGSAGGAGGQVEGAGGPLHPLHHGQARTQVLLYLIVSHMASEKRLGC